jgi:hypothetical protein
LAELCHARSRSRPPVLELPLGRVDPLNLGRCAPFDDQLGEGAVAAADIDPSQAGARRYLIKEDFAREPAPGSHHPLVGGPVVEADLMLGHW